MTDLDQLLARVRGAAPPAGLGDIDEAVMSHLAQIRATPTPGFAAFSAAAALALVIGIGSSVVATTSVGATSLYPLGGVSPLAPSSLLDAR